MLHKNRLWTLYLFYGVNFIATGMSTFAPKFYGEIGLTDGQIGLLSAVMAAVALVGQPAWGVLADRAKYKRSALAAGAFLSGLTCFWVLPASGRFLPLLLVLTLYSTFALPAMPVSNAIAIEYTAETGHSFGPVRMTGTIGYQVGILATGFLLARSLRNLYPAMGAVLLLAGCAALALPGVRGHQTGRPKAAYAGFFKNRALVLLFIVAFLANIGHQFNLAFFSKHLGDLGVSNTVTGFINTFSVLLEIPFLMFGDRIMKRFSIWTWLLLGLIIGGIRFLLLSALTHPVAIVLAQCLSIAHLACFEFFPFIYLGRAAGEALQASAQSFYQMLGFGVARIAASLAGGLLADAFGIPTVYALCGALLLLTAAAFFAPMRRQRLREGGQCAAR